MLPDFLNNQQRHQIHVRRQFEKRFVRGRMVGGVVAETYPDDHFVPMNPQRTEPRQPSVTGSRPRVLPREPDQTPLEHVDLVQPVPNENEDEIINNLPELFDCFSTDGFDTERFKLFARHFLSNKPESSDKRQNERFEREKSEGRLCPRSKPLHHVHLVKGANEKYNSVLEGDDCLHFTGL